MDDRASFGCRIEWLVWHTPNLKAHPIVANATRAAKDTSPAFLALTQFVQNCDLSSKERFFNIEHLRTVSRAPFGAIGHVISAGSACNSHLIPRSSERYCQLFNRVLSLFLFASFFFLSFPRK